MDKATVPLPSVYRLLNPGSVVWLSVGDAERDNLLAITWNMPLKKDPPMCAVLSGKRHFSYPIIEETREFGINVPHAKSAQALYGCGTTTGRDVEDKFARFGLTRQKPEAIKAPLVAEAVANIECRVVQIVDLWNSSLIIADILNATAAVEHFKDGHWCFDNGLELLHHLSGDRFCVSSEVVTIKKS